MSFTHTINKYPTIARRRLLFAAIIIIAAIGGAAAGQGFSGGSRRVHSHQGREGADAIKTLQRALESGSPWLDVLKITGDQRTQLLETVDRHEPRFRELESERARLAEEFASALKGNVGNVADMERVRIDVRALSDQAIDESLALTAEASPLL